MAAGRASRFGAAKQLLEWQGLTLLDRACLTALDARCDPVLRVLGGHASEVLERPCPERIETLVHESWQEGMGSSLAAGVSRLAELAPDLDALFVLLPDQPLVTTELLGSLAAGLEEGKISIVLCDHGKTLGPPSLFRRCHFAELVLLRGDQGAKVLAARFPDAVTTIDFPGGALDIDTPEAWERFTGSRATTPWPEAR
ncbi:NTP transferase domain-containing protein [Luteolibacter sp. Populi]|uniref:nucleotidyltransferase family protein n=1 Tax=Luteolibacter sp. Populi TaxID=3230487 RepID=UPI003465C973